MMFVQRSIYDYERSDKKASFYIKAKVKMKLAGLNAENAAFNYLVLKFVAPEEMLRLGLIDHMVISQDVGFKACFTVNGGYGYAHILKNIVPWF